MLAPSDWNVGPHLEHLNKCNTEIQICHITADQTQTEEETNGHNRAEVNTASHLDSLSAIKKGCSASENLGHESRKSQVPCREDNGEAYRKDQSGIVDRTSEVYSRN